jgi:hypothetical protein
MDLALNVQVRLSAKARRRRRGLACLLAIVVLLVTSVHSFAAAPESGAAAGTPAVTAQNVSALTGPPVVVNDDSLVPMIVLLAIYGIQTLVSGYWAAQTVFNGATVLKSALVEDRAWTFTLICVIAPVCIAYALGKHHRFPADQQIVETCLALLLVLIPLELATIHDAWGAVSSSAINAAIGFVSSSAILDFASFALVSTFIDGSSDPRPLVAETRWFVGLLALAAGISSVANILYCKKVSS